jgi:hypothetical protein
MEDDLAVPRLTVMDAFNKTSYFKKEPEIGFGTGSRPPLMVPTSTPGPGAYQLKSTLNKTLDSSIKSPEQYTIRSRHNFGDPNLKALSKTTANEPGTQNKNSLSPLMFLGPGQYKIANKFVNGTNSPMYSFPKSRLPSDKALLAPGPGQYDVPGSLGKQPLSTKEKAREPGFPLADRPTLIAPGLSTFDDSILI